MESRLWLDHMPPSLQLVLVTRGEPPLPLVRLRARGQVNELTLRDLRFPSRSVRQSSRQAPPGSSRRSRKPICSSLVIAGPFADAFGIQLWFLIAGISCTLMGIFSLFSADVMSMENNSSADPRQTVTGPPDSDRKDPVLYEI